MSYQIKLDFLGQYIKFISLKNW